MKGRFFYPEYYGNIIAEALAVLQRERIEGRIWARDHTVWDSSPQEISNRLGWLSCPWNMEERCGEIQSVVEEIRRDGYTHALLLGMGGSSLAPETFRKIFGVMAGFLELSVLDSTDPASVLSCMRNLNLSHTLFIVSTKSGGTVETFSFLKYFYNQALVALGADQAGRHFIAITDPGSGVAAWAERLGFRHTFLNDPDIGGRFSALSCFGLVPAAMLGMDIRRLLSDTAAAAGKMKSAAQDNQANPLKIRGGGDADVDDSTVSAALLGVALGELAKAGRDKATFFFSPGLESFGNWLEQLLAESTGKDGRGILPVVGEPPGPEEVYGSDRVFISIALGDDNPQGELMRELRQAGHPVLELSLAEPYELGRQIFAWEMATAVAGWRLRINPFDQPDVEAAKVLAREMVAVCAEKGVLPEGKPSRTSEIMDIYGEYSSLGDFLSSGKAGNYIALQAYVSPTTAMDRALLDLREKLRNSGHLATTCGYGPRYLHSTGQLHKGDGGKGLFIQITADDDEDAPIPDEPGKSSSCMTFGTLKAAQAMGDRQALIDKGRRVLRCHFRVDPAAGIEGLLENGKI